MSRAALLLLADARFPTGAHAHSGGIEAAHATGDVHDLDSLSWFIAGRLATTALVDATFTAAATAFSAHASTVRTSSLRTSGAETAHGGSQRQKSRTTMIPDSAETSSLATFVAQTADTGSHRQKSPATMIGERGWAQLDAELAARIPSPRLRSVSRALGRQMLRAGERAWPSPAYTELRGATEHDPFQPIALGTVAAAAGLDPEEAALCALHHQIGTWTTAAVRLLGLDPFAVHALAARLAPAIESLAAEAATLAARDPADLPSTSSPLGDILAEHHATWEVRLFAS